MNYLCQIGKQLNHILQITQAKRSMPGVYYISFNCLQSFKFAIKCAAISLEKKFYKDCFVKLLIRKILSRKKLVRILVALLLAFIAFSAYMLIGIHIKVNQMEEAAKEPITYFPEYPTSNTTGKNADQIKRGEYLVKAGDCIACHTNTPKKGTAFAGGLPMYTPFGVIYSPNITPDKETGIGNWSENDFIKAMHDGIAPSGHYYYPAFPYLYFNKVSIDDLKSIKAYLDSTPAVTQKNVKNDMLFPFNFRFLQLGWRILFFHRESAHPFENNDDESVEWNRGAYLAEGLGHCAMCHTPSYHLLSAKVSLGAPIRKYDLTGAKVQGYLAPNITEINLSKIPDQEIIDVFTKDHMIGGGNIEGPMLEVNHDSLKYMSQPDLIAIATYLKSVQSQTPPRPKGDVAGKALYEEYCSGCHAMGSGGAPKFGDTTAWAPVIKAGMPKVYANAIQGVGGMPAKGTCLSCGDDEVKEAVDYMVAALTGGGAKVAPSVPKPKQLTLDDGKRIYDANCSVCHATGFKGAPIPGDKPAWEKIVDDGFVKTYLNVVAGRNGHPVRGACTDCSDAEIKAAVKYMLQESSTGKDYSLW